MRYLLLITTVALNFVGCTDLDHDNALTQNQLTAQLSDVARWVNPKSVLAKVGNRDNIVNKVSRPFWEKTRFNPDYETKALSSDEWYYRFTVVDAPPNTTALSVADGHWLHPETIRWEITEKFLIGWRAHAVVPGSEDENFDAQDYKGAPVAVFPILEHFDINLSYDAITLEPTNVLAENMDDRQWQKREFFRVDWSQNVAHEKWRTDPYAGRLGAKTLDVDTAHAVANNNPAAPRHYRFEQDYLEVTTRQAVTTDLMALLGYYGEAFGGDGAAPVVSARHSFKKKVKTNYETLHYPNSLALRGFDGQEVRDDKGFSKMIPLWEKFGFYRSSWSGRQTWDKEKGSTESGKQYNITRFNIWEKSYDDNGDLIAVKDRTPKPIVYYTNVHHPKSLMAASRRVAAEWNDVFQETVFYAQPGKYRSKSAVPTMWVLKENSCNLENVSEELKNRKASLALKIAKDSSVSLGEIGKNINDANERNSDLSFTERHNLESQALSDLEKICSALEYYTSNTDNKFTYQRPGDLRYNLLNLIPDRVETGWSGLGPMLADAITGETIQAVANVNLRFIDSRAARASEQIDAINGEVSFGDIVFGRDIKSYVTKKMAESGELSNFEISDDQILDFNDRFSSSELKNLRPGATKARLNRLLERPEFENKLIDSKIEERLFSGMTPYLKTGEGYNLGENILDVLSPLRGNDILAQFEAKIEQEKEDLLSFKDPPEFLDNLVVGVALQYKHLEPEERFYKIREAVYTAVMLHEVGHNMGLVHNMAGSADALNYGKRFWDLQKLPSDLGAAVKVAPDEKTKELLTKCQEEVANLEELKRFGSENFVLDTQTCLRQQEGMYSSIMDYHAMWNSDLNGLGSYDRAAIKFGYAQLLEVFPERNIKADTGKQDLSRWVFLNDWKKIPAQMLKDTESISDREHIVFKWDHNFAARDYPENAVPYLFCADSSGHYGPRCKAWDFGPDMKSAAQLLKTQYWQQYYFTHFNRDRLWSYGTQFSGIVNQDLRIMRNFSDIMRWYYYYKVTVPGFEGSDAEKDFLAATVTGLNHFSHVIGHPEPGVYVTAPAYTATRAIGASADDDRLAPTTLYRKWENLTRCEGRHVANRSAKGEMTPADGYKMVQVGLGDGRPYTMGLTDDYEEWYLTYVGTFYSKLFAANFLANPGYSFPRTEFDEDPGYYQANWFKLFPKEVGGLFYKMITNDTSDLGPLVNLDGQLVHRDLLDLSTLKAPDYTGFGKIEPRLSTVLPFRYMLASGVLTSQYMTSEFDFLKSMRLAVVGDEDHISTTSELDADLLSEFVHPETGETYQAVQIGEFPVSYNLVEKLNVFKERYARLNACVTDPVVRDADSFCACASSTKTNLLGDSGCGEPNLSKVGENQCSLDDLEKRRDIAHEQMGQLVGYLNDMRWMSSALTN